MTRNWRDQAACLAWPSEMFYPDQTAPKHSENARKVCNGGEINHKQHDACPVREQCLEHALTFDKQWGVWGGKTQEEREQIIRQRKKQRARISA